MDKQANTQLCVEKAESGLLYVFGQIVKRDMRLEISRKIARGHRWYPAALAALEAAERSGESVGRFDSSQPTQA